MKTFLLGISVGGGCIAHCGSVLLPMLLCESRRRWHLAGLFLLARLCGYLVFAVISYYTGILFLKIRFERVMIEGGIFILLSILLFRYAWNLKSSIDCLSHCGGENGKNNFQGFRKNARAYAIKAGFLTGLSLCAPFLAVIVEGTQQLNLLGSLTSFLCFYLGTTVVFFPVILTGVLSRGKVIRQIGFLCGFLASGVYFLQGSMLIMGGAL